MDGDPAVEPELDSFSRTLPLPYRVALLVVLGVWAWGTNLQYLSGAKIDVPHLIHYPPRRQRSDLPHHLTTYRLALFLTLPLTISLLLFWALSHRSPTLVIYYDFLPIILLSFIFLVFVLPVGRFCYSGRRRFLSTLKRVSIGGIAQSHEGKFGDILLADVLTSYAKVIADLFVALCMFVQHNGSATARPDRGCGGQYLVPMIIAVPSLIRFRQCLIEYIRVSNSSSGTGYQHLANALKYFSAFPVIVLSALQRKLSVDHTQVGLSEAAVYRAWLVAVLVNSFYSFYWDVVKDWDLEFFSYMSSNQRSHSSSYQSNPTILRPKLMFHSRSLYYSAIFIDFLLRFTWSLKLSPHLDHFADFESGIFLLELLEVARRWMWIFLRVETEWVRQNQVSEVMDGTLLGDYQNKEDDD